MDLYSYENHIMPDKAAQTLTAIMECLHLKSVLPMWKQNVGKKYILV